MIRAILWDNDDVLVDTDKVLGSVQEVVDEVDKLH